MCSKNTLAEYLTVAAVGMIMAVIATNASAATENNACEVYRLDIAAELADRGYAFVPDSCYAEKEGAGFKFTVVVDGVKEVIHCDPAACK